MKQFAIRDREAGNKIEEFDSYEEAIAELENYENEDKEDGYYEEDYYEIVEQFKTNEPYSAIIGCNLVVIRYNGYSWERTDEYDEDVQDYVNFKECYLTDEEIEKIIKGK